jgi:hypothetical protein
MIFLSYQIISTNELIDPILFADDTSLYVTVDTPQNAADITNRDLGKIHQWSVNWLVKFNPQKTETMVISRKLIKPPGPHAQLGESTRFRMNRCSFNELLFILNLVCKI